MDSGPVVPTHVVVLGVRLLDLQSTCEAMAKLCEEKKLEKMGRRFRRAASSFNEMWKEMANESKQAKLF